jgi:hypothetical protein
MTEVTQLQGWIVMADLNVPFYTISSLPHRQLRCLRTETKFRSLRH